MAGVDGIGPERQTRKGTDIMIKTINPREIAASIAGAFIATLLFVSAAVGPLPIA